MESIVNGLFMADVAGSMLASGTSGYQGMWTWDLHNGPAGGSNSASLYGWRQFGDYGILGNSTSGGTGSGANTPYVNYYAEQLLSKIVLAGGTVVQVTSDDPNLDAYAVKEANGHVEMLVINKSGSGLNVDGSGPTIPASPYPSITGTFNFAGFAPAASAQMWQYGSIEDTAQKNAPATQIGLHNFTQALTLNGSSFSLAFPNYSMTVVDLTPAAPQVVTGTYPWQTAGNKIQFTFDQAMDPSTFQIGDLTLINQDGGAVPVIQSVSYDAPTKTATFLLAGTPHDDNYQATLGSGSVSSSAGVATTAASSFNFFALAGDANHDRTVDNADFTILFNHFTQPGTFADGDFDYSGTVDNGDFTMLFNNFTKTLAPPANQVATVIASPAFATTVNTSPTPAKVAPKRQSPVHAVQRVDQLK